MKKILFAILLIVCICSIALASESFTDVSDNHWAVASIERWAEEEVILGYPGGTYKPENYITRAEFCTMLCRILEPAKAADLSKYRDVNGNEWYVEFMAKCLGANIIDPASSNYLKPDGLVTRQEAIVMLNAFIKLVPEKGDEMIKKFADYDEIGDYAEADVEAFVEAGKVIGYEDNTIRPNEPISRAEISAILDRLIYKIITKPGTYDVENTDKLVIVKAEGVTLKNAGDATVIFLNDDVKDSTKGLTDAQKKDSVVVNPSEKSDSKTTSRTTSGGGSQTTPSTKKTAVITITSVEDEAGNYYKITRNGVNVQAGNKITVRVDGTDVVKSAEVSEDSLLGNMLEVARALDMEKVINTIDRTAKYNGDEDIQAWGSLAVKESVDDLERVAALAAAAKADEDHKIKAVFVEMTVAERDAAFDKALEILEAAYNNEYENEDANALVTFDYVTGQLNSANV